MSSNPRVPALLRSALLLGALGLAAVWGFSLLGADAPGPGGTAAATRAADTISLVSTTDVTHETDGVVETRGGTTADGDAPADAARADRARATFAGGCFWCMEPPYDRLEGVVSTTSGFTGGRVEDPSYRQVASGATLHREVVQIVYDPSKVSYTRLLEVFWHNVDPTDDGGQFCDRGFQYTTAIFYHNEEQERLARSSLKRLREWGGLPGRVVTSVRPAEEFYRANAYHQNFYRTHSAHYRSYRMGCGRDQRLREIWGEAAPH